jgi:hypothetical protein
MAKDTAALIDALSLEQRTCWGSPWAGASLELALSGPNRVGRLVLVSTSAAGRGKITVSWPMRLLLPLRWLGLPRGKYPQPRYAYLRQRQASASYDATGRLGDIRVPALILHGRRDRSMPVDLAERMHAGIHGSRAGLFRGSVVPDVTRIGIDHGEEHADALSMLLHRPIRCPARRESEALVGPAQPVVGGAAVASLADGEPFAIDVEGEQHRPGPSRGSAVHIGNGAGIVAATAGAPVHDSQYPGARTAQAAPTARVDRPAACADGFRCHTDPHASDTRAQAIAVLATQCLAAC